MSRGERSKRIARLVSVLAGNRKGSTLAQIVKATGTSRATAYRDLQLLRESGSGFNLTVSTVNGEARYSVAASTLAIDTMTPHELAALTLARRALRAVEGTRPVRELDGLLQRSRDVAREDDGILWKLGGMAYDPALLAIVHQAVVDQRMLRLRYRGAKDTTQQNRTVHPCVLQVVDQQPYLVAWDEQRRALRTFKLARATQAKLLRTKCKVPQSARSELEADGTAVKVWRGGPIAVRVRIAGTVARYLSEWPLVVGQTLEPAPHGAVDVCARVYGVEETLRWVLRWGRNARIIAPDALRDRVTEELRVALHAYEDVVSHDRETHPRVVR